MKWVLLMYITSIQLSSFGQQFDGIFSLSVKDAKLTFKLPEGFKELDSTASFKCWDRKSLPGSIIYLLANHDSSIVIGFVNVMDKTSQSYDPIKNVSISLYHEGDEKLSPTNIYGKKHLKKFNADIGGEYTRNCVKPFLGKYTNNRFVVIGKAEAGEATMVYFFKDEALDIKKVIRKTNGMLRFR